MAEEPAKPAAGAPPSKFRQKTFIAENGGILDDKAKKAILRLVMMEVGKAVTVRDEDGNAEEVRPVVLEQGATGEVSIHLDNIDNEEVLLHIYNIVANRRATLSEPVRGAQTAAKG